ncbi:MAG: hypothetical protein JWQ68_1555 [Cryobacterium sp.]|jgi:hypothetical protein|nr:hypothetical protein [Cryobacterium sp.]
MELLFVALGGALLGILARYVVRGRSTQGSAVIPAIGTATASVVWVALTWLGWAWDGGWIWWASLGGAALASVVADILISRRRSAHDRRMLQTLSKTGVPKSA